VPAAAAALPALMNRLGCRNLTLSETDDAGSAVSGRDVPLAASAAPRTFNRRVIIWHFWVRPYFPETFSATERRRVWCGFSRDISSNPKKSGLAEARNRRFPALCVRATEWSGRLIYYYLLQTGVS
jgi:hypothetical protein